MKKKITCALVALTLLMSACAADTVTSETDTETFTDESGFLEGADISAYVTLGDIESIEVTYPSTDVTEEEIDDEIESLEASLSTVEVTDRDVTEDGDILNVDYSGRLKEDDTVFDGGTAEGATVELGTEGYVEGFLEGMIGQTVGETFEEEVTFPDDYENNTDLQGKEVIFTVTINSISTRPKLTDETVAELAESDLGISDITSMQDLRDYVEEELIAEKEADNEANLGTYALEAAVEDATFADELPAGVLARLENQLRTSYENYAYIYQAYYGSTDTADDLIQSAMDEEGFEGTADEYISKTALDNLKQILVCYAVFEAQEMTVDEEELKSSIADVLVNSGYSSVSEYEDASGINLFDSQNEQLKYEAAVAYLEEHAVITE